MQDFFISVLFCVILLVGLLVASGLLVAIFFGIRWIVQRFLKRRLKSSEGAPTATSGAPLTWQERAAARRARRAGLASPVPKKAFPWLNVALTAGVLLLVVGGWFWAKNSSKSGHDSTGQVTASDSLLALSRARADSLRAIRKMREQNSLADMQIDAARPDTTKNTSKPLLSFSLPDFLKQKGQKSDNSVTQAPETMKIALAIKQTESKSASRWTRGSNGEVGFLQWLPGNWQIARIQYQDQYGILPPAEPDSTDPTLELQVGMMIFESQLNRGWTPRQIALAWNTGEPDEASPAERDSSAQNGVPYADVFEKNFAGINNGDIPMIGLPQSSSRNIWGKTKVDLTPFATVGLIHWLSLGAFFGAFFGIKKLAVATARGLVFWVILGAVVMTWVSQNILYMIYVLAIEPWGLIVHNPTIDSLWWVVSNVGLFIFFLWACGNGYNSAYRKEVEKRKKAKQKSAETNTSTQTPRNTRQQAATS